jgi:hypothetical protein
MMNIKNSWKISVHFKNETHMTRIDDRSADYCVKIVPYYGFWGSCIQKINKWLNIN